MNVAYRAPPPPHPPQRTRARHARHAPLRVALRLVDQDPLQLARGTAEADR
eukprot:CAMPEP_0174742320 /NCGR_PEP_ID=MMETSP1094-20130205/78579_1 /TAXON_ID=156173 /ORGANISM="Chrysochromulina brevifilum, Strain UTEX LB 985" /LENGTH=50 /DNA_ID=CAMNT_0015946357 /DNA_START=135 /DNA_END=283 /DNA_ORIENTATION=-